MDARESAEEIVEEFRRLAGRLGGRLHGAVQVHVSSEEIEALAGMGGTLRIINMGEFADGEMFRTIDLTVGGLKLVAMGPRFRAVPLEG